MSETAFETTDYSRQPDLYVVHNENAGQVAATVHDLDAPVQPSSLPAYLPADAEPRFPLHPDYDMAEIAEQKAAKLARWHQSFAKFSEIQAARAERKAKLQELADLAGKRAIFHYNDGTSEEVFVAGLEKYEGNIVPNYDRARHQERAFHPEPIGNSVVVRSPEINGSPHKINPGSIATSRPCEDAAMPFRWEGDDS